MDTSGDDIEVGGRSLADISGIADAFGLSMTVVARLLKVHGERLEERLLDDRDGALRAAGVDGIVDAEAAPAAAAAPPPPVPDPAVPEAASEPEETVTLLLGREPKTETLDVALRDLTLIGSETLHGFLWARDPHSGHQPPPEPNDPDRNWLRFAYDVEIGSAEL